MLKRIVMVSIALMLIVPFCFADNNSNEALKILPDQENPNKKVIGIFFEAPAIYANNATIRELIVEKSAQIFPEAKFDILPMEKTQMEMNTYRQSNHLMFNNEYIQPLDKADIQKLSQKSGCNFALFISASNSRPTKGSELFRKTSFKTSITCDIRLLNVETGQYTVGERVMKEGETTELLEEMPYFEKSYNNTISKALSEIKKLQLFSRVQPRKIKGFS